MHIFCFYSNLLNKNLFDNFSIAKYFYGFFFPYKLNSCIFQGPKSFDLVYQYIK